MYCIILNYYFLYFYEFVCIYIVFLFIECVVQIFPTVPSLTTLDCAFYKHPIPEFQPFLPGCARDGLGALAEPEVPERQESGDIHGSWARWRVHEMRCLIQRHMYIIVYPCIENYRDLMRYVYYSCIFMKFHVYFYKFVYIYIYICL